MLKLICGPSGAGKTEYLTECIEADIRAGVRSLLLIPEQQAYISERSLAERLPKNAGLFFDVVSFSGLAEKVFCRYGGVTTESVSGAVSSLLMWHTLATLSPLLEQYGKSAEGDLTLTNLMLSAVAEMRAGGVSAQALEDAAAQMEAGSALQKKLSDLALIDAAYHAKIEECFGTDPSDKLLRLSTVLQKHRHFENCNVYVDSFTSFTVPEYAVLLQILEQANCVTVSLCTDCVHSKLPHFLSVSDTAKQLTHLADRANAEIENITLSTENPHRINRTNVEVKNITHPTNKCEKSKALCMLEKDLWRFSAAQTPLADDNSVRLSIASNIYDEAEAAALQICELVSDGKRYGEIAVVVRDLDAYRGILDAALERHGIPYFFSERTDLSSKPIFRLILSALRAVSRNWRQSDIITLLKTGLCGTELRDAAMFEEYVETWHIGGRRFLDDVWSMNPDGLTTERSPRAEEILDAANRVRRQLMAPLMALSASLRASRRLEDRCRALYEYLSAIELPLMLASRAKEELSLGQVREAGESLRLYSTLLDTLTTLCRLLPDCELSIEEFISALTLVFSNADLGSIPNTQDSVVIGSADTLRVENIRASILLGLCEGEFPRAVANDGILTEADKEALEEYGIILQSRERLRSSEELFYVYRAMSKPSEFLSLFTHAKQTDGSARTPSLAFNRVAFLLDKKPEIIDFAEIRRARALPTDEELRKPLRASASEERVSLRLSQSKIQAFVLCPYRYYSTYSLKLREKKDSQPSYADDGTFLHYVFEHFLRASLTAEGKLSLPAPEDVEPLADNIINDYIGEVCPFPAESMDNRLLHLYARLRRLALKMLHEILGEIRTGLFVPTYFEKGIGMREEGSLPPVRLTLEDGSSVLLNGKIDRVDIYESDEKLYFRVVDYKSGKHTFSLDEVRSGMDIQLILYLFAISGAMPNATPAGAQYLFASTEKGITEIKRSGLILDEEAVSNAVNGQSEAVYSKGLTKQTLDQMHQLQAEMQDAVLSVARRILSGEAEKTPSEKACGFCPVRAECNRAYHN